MIHPFHSAELVNKMPKVGVLKSYRKDYVFDTPFERVRLSRRRRCVLAYGRLAALILGPVCVCCVVMRAVPQDLKAAVRKIVKPSER